MGTSRNQGRVRAARELAEILDSRLFSALCEPARVEIVKFLTAHGRADVGTISAQVPQDTSVVSRHLAILHEAGVLRREREGRHAYFQVDGANVLERLEQIVERVRRVVPHCCGASELAAPRRKR